MRRLVVIATLVIAGTEAFALQITTCSNADGSIKRSEQEIWGANPVIWTINGTDHTAVKEINLVPVKNLDSEIIERSQFTRSETYVVQKELKYTANNIFTVKTPWVICTTKSSNALD